MQTVQNVRSAEQASLSQALLSSTHSVSPPHESLVAALEAGARGDAPFLTLHTSSKTEELGARRVLEGASRVGALLAQHGVRSGDRVPILLPTSSDFVHTLLGTMLLGAIPVPLASPMTFGSLDRYVANLAAVIDDADARCMVTTERVSRALQASSAQSRLKHVLVRSDLAAAPDRQVKVPSIGGADLALLQYTSGTTGRPKGVALSHRAMVSNTYSIAKGMALQADDVGVSWLPMFHDMGLIGMVLTSLCHPYPVHVMAPESFVMRPRRWLALISELGGTLSAAPNFAYDLCTAKVDPSRYHLDTWRGALNGSEAVHRSTVDRFAERFSSAGFQRSAMTPVYGLAEATLAVTFPRLGAELHCLDADRRALEERGVFEAANNGRALMSVGEPVAGTDIRIAADNGQVLAPGAVGEVQITGPSLMEGYFRNEKASAEALVGGWLRTGDLGFIFDGRLYITGRARDLIIQGGRNISPEDVERVVTEAAQEAYGAAAFPRVCEESGTEELIVVLEVREKDFEKRQNLEKMIRGELLTVLGIRADEVLLWPVGGIPRTTSGKVRRAECARKTRGVS